MREQVDRLQKLTTDLLDLSRLDAGSLELELEPVPLRTLADQVAGEFAAAAARKDSTIDVTDRTSQLDIEAVCDPQRVAQIVRMLIDNALVHTPEGTGSRSRRAAAAGDGRPGDRRLRVTDDGPGIRRRELRPRLRALPHERLGGGLRASGSRSRASSRSGCGARLEVASRPGQHRLHAHAAARRRAPGRARGAVRRTAPPRAEVSA